MEQTLLAPDRKGSYLSLAFGIVCAAVGAAMVAKGNDAGIVVLVLAAVGLYAGVAGFVPGLGFTPTRVRVGRRADVDVVEIRYQAGIGDRRKPQHVLGRFLGVDERYLIAGYGRLSSTQLADLLEKYRAASV